MKVRLLAVQYKQPYPKALAPNIMAVTDEFIDDENPAYFQDECAKQLAELKNDIEAHAVIEIDIPVDLIDKALYPQQRPTIQINNVKAVNP